MKSINKQAIAAFLIILQCLIFGMAFIAIKKMAEQDFPIFLLLSIRFFGGACSLLALGCIFNLSPKINESIGAIGRFNKAEFSGGLLSGTLLFGAFAFQTFGANITTPAKNGVFTDLFVVVVPIIAMIKNKKINTQHIIAAVITFLGATIVLGFYSDKTNFNVGDILSIICGIVFAIQFIVTEAFAMPSNKILKINPYNFTVIQLFIVSVFSVFASVIIESKTYVNINWNDTFIWLVYLCICATGIAYLLQFFAQTKISAETTAALSCSESLFTFVFSVMFGYDKLSWSLTIGFLIMILGMLLSTISFNNKTKDE